MKLIDIDTGQEWEIEANAKGLITGRPTGKTYEKREATSWLDRPYFCATNVQNQEDTHRAICFLEKLEQAEPMPEILPGDLIHWLDDCSPYYVLADNLEGIKSMGAFKRIYRNGVKIWELK